MIQRNGTWHMFASQMVNGCGLNYWAMNSQVIRATSDNPLGPYTYQQVILPVFAHDANVMEAPTGEIVLLVTARKGVRPYNCNNVNTTTNNASPPPSFQNSTTPPKDSYMLWAPQPEGPWSEPVLVLNSTIWNADYWNVTGRVAHCDSNLNGIINDDGSFLGLWRKCETLNLLTIPHRLTATDWKNASTYQPHLQPLFVLAGSGAEDPTNIWTTTINGLTAYHAIFHDEQATRCMLGQCSANGRHAFSLDGKSWRYASRNAYSKSVEFWNPTNNSTETLSLDTRARPHVVLDRPTGSLLALSTGVEANKPEVSDYVYTLVQPLRRREKEEEDSIQPQHSSMTKSIVRG